VATANPTPHRLQQNANVRDLVEAWDRVLISTSVFGSANRVFKLSFYAGATEVASARFIAQTNTIELYSGTATLLATSPALSFPSNRYFVAAAHYRISDTVGLLEVYVDDVLMVTYSGDTKPGADTTFDSVGYGSAIGWYLDEYCRNSITMEYDGGSGTAPVAGQTVTGAGGGTAVITSVEGDATSGILVLQQWNSTNFVNNEVLTSPTLNAFVNAPTVAYASGFQPNSKRPGTGYVVARVPTGAGTTTALTPSTGVTNWSLVDEIPPNTTDYVFSGTPDTYDTYAKSTALPASAISVIAVGGYHYALRDGIVVNNARHVVRTGGVDYFGVNTAVSTSYSAGLYTWNVNPGTLTEWTVAELNAAEVGFQVRT